MHLYQHRCSLYGTLTQVWMVSAGTQCIVGDAETFARYTHGSPGLQFDCWCPLRTFVVNGHPKLTRQQAVLLGGLLEAPAGLTAVSGGQGQGWMPGVLMS
jgi:hypothetical protein